MSARWCDGIVEHAVPNRKWLGVKASKSVASELTGTSGREFRLCSTKQNVVVKISSVSRRFPRIARKMCLKLLTIRSQTPPWWGALGGFNFHWIRYLTSVSDKVCWFQVDTFCTNSFSLATKFVPLSDHKTDGTPRRAANLSIPITQLLVSLDGTTSKWTALVVKQVNRNPHRFSVDLFTATKYRQKNRFRCS